MLSKTALASASCKMPHSTALSCFEQGVIIRCNFRVTVQGVIVEIRPELADSRNWKIETYVYCLEMS